MAKALSKTAAVAAKPIAKTSLLSLPYLLSSLLALVTITATAAGFFITDLFQKDNLALAGNARGTALVILAVAVPVMVVSMFLSARGNLRARLVWLGMVTYIFYNSFYFTFSTTFHRFFLVFLAMLSLSGWALLVLLMHTNVEQTKAAFAPKTPVRFTAIVLLFPVLIFLIVDLKEMLISTIENSLPVSILNTQMPSNHFHVVDLAFLVPVFLMAAVWLWQRRAWGFTLAGMMMSYYTIELFGIGIDQWFGGRADPTSPLADASALPVFVAMSAAYLMALMFFIRNLTGKAK